MSDILVTGFEIASNSNLLTGTRLETIPAFSRLLHFRCSCSDNSSTNHALLTIELPNGAIPVDGQRVPANQDNTIGTLDERSLLQWTWAAVVGGRFIISIVEVGAVSFVWLAQLQ